MDEERRIITREILFSFWKVHILHHAGKEPVVGQWMLQELRRHGYEVSPGTMYPLLQRMERNGWLRCVTAAKGGVHARKSYYLTAKGRRVLKIVLAQIEELRGEVRHKKRKG
jgi:DNA-binding PadR family transcriptional regulator